MGPFILIAIICIAWSCFRDQKPTDSQRSNATMPMSKELRTQSGQESSSLRSGSYVETWDVEPYQASYIEDYRDHDTYNMYEDCDSELEEAIDWDSVDYE